VFALSVALLLRYFIIEAYRIPSFAMKPTLLAGDTIFVTKWPFKLKKAQMPKRGDVVIFSLPQNPGTTSPNYVRRVIGLPGDQVSLKNGHVILNGKSLAAPNPQNQECSQETLPEGKQFSVCRESPVFEDFDPETVPEGSVFVIGDLRSSGHIKKRKGWGLVPLKFLSGHAQWVWLSIDPHQKNSNYPKWVPHLRLDRMFQRIH
jgi:signal peptidase I